MDTSMDIIELNRVEVEELEDMLDEYDRAYIQYKIEGAIHIGIKQDGQLIAGVDACMTSFKILYISTVYVDERYRRLGLGTKLMGEVEKRARELGANMIRLDTFDWQGREFYLALGYEQAGNYTSVEDGFSEYFFVKRV
ncbi:GNAT family N-acetyltransferase [Anaeromicropila herbilytica]|uniref:N-acetyltransferase domain-containing protein n=1 Tax=Anaeromicropila herbilytica TaxID=2785025 RepID=A0A7R7IEG5_9FIRM|nr:GNAT family N-acetyltransferase [Anaeromicropila herbilytica]BCN32688.1 hypothetical protein bsdtb5_39830 [Anaeromicropila herbilytica]